MDRAAKIFGVFVYWAATADVCVLSCGYLYYSAGRIGGF